jgi:F0F1-type ATP synthase assembly protein I
MGRLRARATLTSDAPKQQPPQPPPQSPWNLLAVSLQMAVSVSLGVTAGWWLDQRCGWAPWGVVGGVALGTGVGIYLVIKETA